MPPSYNVVRCDRQFSLVDRSTGGGVFIALSDDIPYEVIDTSFLSSSVPLIDIVICKCKFNSISIFVACVYIPPNVSQHDFDFFCDALEALLLDKLTLLLGDFNLPQFSSNPLSCLKCCTFNCLCNLLKLQQFNTIVNCDNRLLDLVAANFSSSIIVSSEEYPLVPLDQYHPALSISISFSTCPVGSAFPSNTNNRYNFSKANFHQLYNDLRNADWSALMEFSDVNLALESFYDTLYAILDVSVPKYCTISNAAKYPAWFSSTIISNLKLKEYYRRKWKSTNKHAFYTEFKRLRSLCKDAIAAAYTSYHRRVEESLIVNPRSVFQYIHAKQGITRLPKTLFHDNACIENPQNIVDTFADQFSSIHTASTDYTTNNSDFHSNHTPFTILPVSGCEVEYYLKRFPLTNVAGDDLIPSFILHDARFILAKPLTQLINMAIATCTFPTRWKRARISPVFKKKDRSHIENYRPISILSNFGKLFESIIYSCLYHNTKSSISPYQHGFIKGRSTVTNLLTIGQFINEHLDARGQVDVIYTDLSSAFDIIDHGFLIAKLSTFGMSTSLLLLLQSYLSSRCHYVFYNGYKSYEFFPTSGVPQGSHLGPLLFVLFVNDLLTSFSCPALAYADDLKIYQSITSWDDVLHLQHNLNVLTQWCSKFKLKLNVSKCCFVSFTRKLKPINSSYLLEHSLLPKVSEMTDLGVLFDMRLTFAPHVNNICVTASKTLGFVLRTCKLFSNPSLFKVLFFSFVVSKLEYASCVWSPSYHYLQLAIEKVQRRFLKYLSFKMDGFYPERGTDYGSLLSRHDVQPLQFRREVHGARFVWKLIHGVVDSPCLLSSINFLVPRLSSRSSPTFALPFPRTNLLQSSPLSRMCRAVDIYYDDVFFNTMI